MQLKPNDVSKPWGPVNAAALPIPELMQPCTAPITKALDSGLTKETSASCEFSPRDDE